LQRKTLPPICSIIFARKTAEQAKKLARGVTGMYKYSNGQISLADFKQPVGMHLKESNRWVKKAQTIP